MKIFRHLFSLIALYSCLIFPAFGDRLKDLTMKADGKSEYKAVIERRKWVQFLNSRNKPTTSHEAAERVIEFFTNKKNHVSKEELNAWLGNNDWRKKMNKSSSY